MIRHRHIHRNLYEYIAGGLSGELRTEIEVHLRTCDRCRAAHHRMTQTLSLLRAPQPEPASERSEEFWVTFAARVEASIPVPERRRRTLAYSIREDFSSILAIRWRTATAIAGAFALASGLFLLLRSGTPGEMRNAAATSAAVTGPSTADRSLGQYFRRSQTVLVGLENKEIAPGRKVDLDAERAVSRTLAYEARFLKNQPIDPRSARLVRDLERIFIKVANSSPEDDHSDFELIRGGIRQENLLFKVRMAQTRYQPEDDQ